MLLSFCETYSNILPRLERYTIYTVYRGILKYWLSDFSGPLRVCFGGGGSGYRPQRKMMSSFDEVKENTKTAGS